MYTLFVLLDPKPVPVILIVLPATAELGFTPETTGFWYENWLAQVAVLPQLSVTVKLKPEPTPIGIVAMIEVSPQVTTVIELPAILTEPVPFGELKVVPTIVTFPPATAPVYGVTLVIAGLG